MMHETWHLLNQPIALLSALVSLFGIGITWALVRDAAKDVKAANLNGDAEWLLARQAHRRFRVLLVVQLVLGIISAGAMMLPDLPPDMPAWVLGYVLGRKMLRMTVVMLLLWLALWEWDVRRQVDGT